ncbi:MAG: hypothetical protein AB1847_22605, partial [bacterium]
FAGSVFYRKCIYRKRIAGKELQETHLVGNASVRGEFVKSALQGMNCKSGYPILLKEGVSNL